MGSVESRADSASMFVRAYASGFPRRERERRWLLILQACFDDSGSDSKSDAYVLAGWLAPVPTWESFSDAWDAELKTGERPVEYFKMFEAMDLSAQFNGWGKEARDAKLMKLGAIIADHDLVRVGVGLNRRLYDNIVKPSGMAQKYFSDPYFLLFYECVMLIGRTLNEMDDPPEACDLIFDQHGKIGNRALHYWERAVKGFADVGFPFSDRLRMPRFEDDKKFRPLQASDMFAWICRRRGGGNDHPITAPLLDQWSGLPWHTKLVTRDSMIELVSGFLVKSKDARRP